jgi:hypothetical protein
MKLLAIFVEQIAAFTTRTPSVTSTALPPAMPVGWNCQNSMSCRANPGTQCHADAVAGVDVGVGGVTGRCDRRRRWRAPWRLALK